MYKKVPFIAAYFITSFFILGCSQQNIGQDKSFTIDEQWNKGKAEVNTYLLTQARYGELRDSGEVVLVFVKENFLEDKQVKADDYTKGIPVLKMNYIKRFVTGIYDYSMMSSVFLPFNQNQYPNALKVTSSSQDWCGQTYVQMNFKNKKYQLSNFSYFESDGDYQKTLDNVFLEDQIFNQIKMNPDKLPVGKFKIIPSMMYCRLKHVIPSVQEVEGKIYEENGLKIYEIVYPNNEKHLKIYFETEAPYLITRWEETYKDGFGEHSHQLTTTAVLKTSYWVDYWSKNKNSDIHWRDSL